MPKTRSQGWREPIEPFDELHHRRSLSPPMLDQLTVSITVCGCTPWAGRRDTEK